MCSQQEAISDLIQVYRRASRRERKHCTLVIDAQYIEFSTMYNDYKLQRYKKPVWPVASLPCHLADIIEDACVSQGILDEYGDPWGYDWDAVETNGMRVGEYEIEIGCSDHGWISVSTLSEWIKKSDDFYCDIGLIILQDADSFGDHPHFSKFIDDLSALSNDVKVVRIK